MNRPVAMTTTARRPSCRRPPRRGPSWFGITTFVSRGAYLPSFRRINPFWQGPEAPDSVDLADYNRKLERKERKDFRKYQVCPDPSPLFPNACV